MRGRLACRRCGCVFGLPLDNTPRDEMRAELMAEVELALASRKEQP